MKHYLEYFFKCSYKADKEKQINPSSNVCQSLFEPTEMGWGTVMAYKMGTNIRFVCARARQKMIISFCIGRMHDHDKEC